MSVALVDIIIPIFNRIDLTRACLASVQDKSKTPYNIILIDNASDETTKRFLENFGSLNKNITIIRNDSNVGWVKAVNQGIKICKSPYLCVMNNDTIVRTDDWFSGLIKVAELAPDIGLVNPYFEARQKAAENAPFVEIDFCRGYCILIKRAVVEKIGFLDEAYGLGYYDDDDYSVRAIRAGFRCVRANDVFVEHLGDSTFNLLFKDEKRQILHERNKELFYSKWGKRLNIVFIATKDVDGKSLGNLLFSIARRQHIIYLWNQGASLGLPHINIREQKFPGVLSILFFASALYLNIIKKGPKQYNIVFIDNPGIASILSKIRPGIYCVDVAKDAAKINNIINSAARA